MNPTKPYSTLKNAPVHARRTLSKPPLKRRNPKHPKSRSWPLCSGNASESFYNPLRPSVNLFLSTVKLQFLIHGEQTGHLRSWCLYPEKHRFFCSKRKKWKRWKKPFETRFRRRRGSKCSFSMSSWASSLLFSTSLLNQRMEDNASVQWRYGELWLLFIVRKSLFCSLDILFKEQWRSRIRSHFNPIQSQNTQCSTAFFEFAIDDKNIHKRLVRRWRPWRTQISEGKRQLYRWELTTRGSRFHRCWQPTLFSPFVVYKVGVDIPRRNLQAEMGSCTNRRAHTRKMSRLKQFLKEKLTFKEATNKDLPSGEKEEIQKAKGGAAESNATKNETKGNIDESTAIENYRNSFANVRNNFSKQKNVSLMGYILGEPIDIVRNRARLLSD